MEPTSDSEEISAFKQEATDWQRRDRWPLSLMIAFAIRPPSISTWFHGITTQIPPLSSRLHWWVPQGWMLEKKVAMFRPCPPRPVVEIVKFEMVDCKD